MAQKRGFDWQVCYDKTNQIKSISRYFNKSDKPLWFSTFNYPKSRWKKQSQAKNTFLSKHFLMYVLNPQYCLNINRFQDEFYSQQIQYHYIFFGVYTLRTKTCPGNKTYISSLSHSFFFSKISNTIMNKIG